MQSRKHRTTFETCNKKKKEVYMYVQEIHLIIYARGKYSWGIFPQPLDTLSIRASDLGCRRLIKCNCGMARITLGRPRRGHKTMENPRMSKE